MSVLAYSRRRILTVQPLCHSGRLLVFVCMAVLGYVVWVVCGVCGVCVVYSTNVFFRYVWMEMPEHERSRLQSEADPHRTATLPLWSAACVCVYGCVRVCGVGGVWCVWCLCGIFY